MILAFISTVELDFKNCQDKNQFGFKNQITNDQLSKISFKNRQDKNNLTLGTKMAVTKNVLKVKFDCMYFEIFYQNSLIRKIRVICNVGSVSVKMRLQSQNHVQKRQMASPNGSIVNNMKIIDLLMYKF